MLYSKSTFYKLWELHNHLLLLKRNTNFFINPLSIFFSMKLTHMKKNAMLSKNAKVIQFSWHSAWNHLVLKVTAFSAKGVIHKPRGQLWGEGC